jgi:NADH:ubiquinone oxidoreductase subunit F (NADH-binding)
MGTTLREIIYDIGGGIKDGKKFKAAQSGGPSGGVIPEQYLDTPIDYNNLTAIGSMMGSGGLIVMDEDDCIVDIIKFYLQFTVDESCGKCAPCRVGGKQLLSILEDITSGKGDDSSIKKLKDISLAMNNASLCGLGQTASNPVMSTLKYFINDYIEHIDLKKCSAGKCKSLMTFTIAPDKCIGCTACARKCPANAITGIVKQKHLIDQTKCIKCGACVTACKFDAVIKG